VLTSNTALAKAPGNTRLAKRLTGLRRDCVANASQIVTLNKSDLGQRTGTLPKSVMDRVDSGLRWFLHLDACEKCSCCRTYPHRWRNG